MASEPQKENWESTDTTTRQSPLGLHQSKAAYLTCMEKDDVRVRTRDCKLDPSILSSLTMQFQHSIVPGQRALTEWVFLLDLSVNVLSQLGVLHKRIIERKLLSGNRGLSINCQSWPFPSLYLTESMISGERQGLCRNKGPFLDANSRHPTAQKKMLVCKDHEATHTSPLLLGIPGNLQCLAAVGALVTFQAWGQPMWEAWDNL